MTIARTTTLAAVSAIALLWPASALGAPAGGETTIRLGGVAYRSLTGQGVTVGAARPATRRHATLTLPAVRIALGSAATVTHRGAIRLRVRRGRRVRTVMLGALTLRVGPASRLSARVGDRRLSLFAVRAATAARTLDRAGGRVALRTSPITLTRAGAVWLRRALGLRTLSPGTFGRVRVAAMRTGAGVVGAPPPSGDPGVPPAAGGAPSSGPGGGAPTGSGGPSSTCRTASASGGPTAPARPGGARDVVAGRLTWLVRPSFVQYLSSGQGMSAAGGAVLGAPTVQAGSPTALVYDVTFPLQGGWFDPATGQVDLRFGGVVCFLYRAHLLDVRVSDPELVLAGGGSRVVAVTADQTTQSRVTLATLTAPAAAGDTRGGGGPTYQVTGIPASVLEGGDILFAGMYQPGDSLGAFSVTFTTA